MTDRGQERQKYFTARIPMTPEEKKVLLMLSGAAGCDNATQYIKQLIQREADARPDIVAAALKK